MVFDDALQQVKSGLGGQVKQQVLGVKKPAGKSVGFLKQINPFEKKDSAESGTVQHLAEQNSAQKAEATDNSKANEDLVKGLYGVEQPQQPQSEETKKLLKDNKDKSPQDIQKLLQLKNQLHQEYYQKLLNPEKRTEEAQEDQERAADRVERLHQEDLQEKQKKEEKKKPIAVDRAETARERKSAGAG